MDELIAIVVIIVLAVSAAFGAAKGINYYQCSSYEEATGTKTKLVGFDCYLEVNGKFIIWDEYKAGFERNSNIKLEHSAK